ncbi:MAG: outer membrane beta-barrel protein [Reyranella sp.]|nr:outer membrane beta-barrel protein [Reyranella sp.]
MNDKSRAVVVALLATLAGAPAGATDGPAAPSNWTGFYLGGHVGAAAGLASFSDPLGPPLFGGTVAAPGFLAGLQAGYNRQVAPQWVVGLEADASLLAAAGSNTCLQSSSTINGSTCKVMPRELATLTGRLGFLTEPRGRTMLFGKAGVAWMRADVSANPNNAVDSSDQGFADEGVTFSDTPDQAGPTSQSISSWGWTAGAGVEHALTPAWSLKFQYDYLRFSGMSLATPQTNTVTAGGTVNNLPSSGPAGVALDMHTFKVGLNFRFGAAAAPATDGPATYGTDKSAATPWAPGWEVETGARYWYSWGKSQNQNANASPNLSTNLVSRLTYEGVMGQSGELFARVDTPIDIFVKGFLGGGGLSNGKMYDEDWGLSAALSSAPTAYEVTQSNVNGTLHYLTGDIGYSVTRARDHKVGLFVGYNLYKTTMNAMGCVQLVNPASGVCAPPAPATETAISQFDTWQSVRVGVAAETRVWDRLKIGADVAYLPYVAYTGLDIHRSRNPPVYFPVSGTGQGVQAEFILSYQTSDAFSIGVGGRYWGMWTNVAAQSDSPSNLFSVETARYGMFVQASYRFNPAR